MMPVDKPINVVTLLVLLIDVVFPVETGAVGPTMGALLVLLLYGAPPVPELVGNPLEKPVGINVLVLREILLVIFTGMKVEDEMLDDAVGPRGTVLLVPSP